MYNKQFIQNLKKTRKEMKENNIMTYLSMNQLYRNVLRSSLFLHGKGRRGREYRDIIKYLIIKTKSLHDSKRLDDLTRNLRSLTEKMCLEIGEQVTGKKVNIYSKGIVDLDENDIIDDKPGDIERTFDFNVLPDFIPVQTYLNFWGVDHKKADTIKGSMLEIKQITKDIKSINRGYNEKIADEKSKENTQLHLDILRRKEEVFGKDLIKEKEDQKILSKRKRRLWARAQLTKIDPSK